MLNLLVLTGWGQKKDSLKTIFSRELNRKISIHFFDYSPFGSFKDLSGALLSFTKQHHIKDFQYCCGWSLGAQLLLRLTSDGIIKPRKIIVLAPPFQLTTKVIPISFVSQITNLDTSLLEDYIANNQDIFISEAKVKTAMSVLQFSRFYANFVNSPYSTAKTFAVLNSLNDRNKDLIINGLDLDLDKLPSWRFWLEYLASNSCANISIPVDVKVVIFHGVGDMVVHFSQAELFRDRIENLEIRYLKECGHAPHLSHTTLISNFIDNEFSIEQ